MRTNDSPNRAFPRPKWWLAASFLLLVVAATLIGYSDLLPSFDWLTLARQAEHELVRYRLLDPLAVVVGLFTLHVLLSAASLPGGSVVMLVAGASYGLAAGTLLCLTACTVGATITMLVSRRLLRAMVRRRFGHRLAEIDAGIARHGPWFLFSLRMMPVIPYAVVNLLCGLSRLGTWTFFWVSFAGMLAGTAIYVNAGAHLGRVSSLADLASPSLLAALAAAALLPLAVHLLLARRRLAASTVDGPPVA